MKEFFEDVLKFNQRPPLFEPREPRFWDDPYISQSMLGAHLDSSHDAASRKPQTIDKTVEHWLSSGILKPGVKVLDLGCGPGLYAEKLSKAGIKVVGMDLSQRSLDYATQRAKETSQKIDYVCMDFFDMDYREEFDAILQVYGEVCVFPDEKRDILLRKIHQSLKKDGLFIFDVSTRTLRRKDGLKKLWYVSEGGFWRPGKHLVLEEGFDYPETNVWLDQYIVIDERDCKVYRNWFHDYSRETISRVLQLAGFEVRHAWNDLTGTVFSEEGEWVALAVVKR
jgi:SAM-dependent methyltransferase